MEAAALRDRLLQRGFSHNCLKKAFRWANGQERHKLLFGPKKKKGDETDIVRINHKIP